jgi:hypothetical protein
MGIGDRAAISFSPSRNADGAAHRFQHQTAELAIRVRSAGIWSCLLLPTAAAAQAEVK